MNTCKPFYWQLWIVLFLLTACSQEELIIPGGGSTPNGGATNRVREVEVILNLGVKSGIQLSGRSLPNTRAVGIADDTKNVLPRELVSWDPAQQVNDMRIYVFRTKEENGKNGEYTYYIPKNAKEEEIDYFNVTDVEKGIFNNIVPHTGDDETHTYAIRPRLEEGYWYKFLAVGRDDKYATDEFIKDEKKKFVWGHKVLNGPELKPDTTTFHEASISVPDLFDVQWCTEIFSGILRDEKGEEDAELVSSSSPGIGPRTITLKRAVAGIIMYVKNIPCWVEDNSGDRRTNGISFKPQRITINLTYESLSVNLAKRLGVEKSGNTSGGEYVATIDLKDKTWGTKDLIFTRPAIPAKGWPANSAMTSNYLMPTSVDEIEENDYGLNGIKDKYGATFTLQYFASESGNFTRFVKIKIKESYNTQKTPETPGNPYLFPIEANHLYSLGRKDSLKNEPFDLSPTVTEDEIVITVNPEWDWTGDLSWGD